MKSKVVKGKVLVTVPEPLFLRVQRLVKCGAYPTHAAVLFHALRLALPALEKEAGVDPDDP